MNPGPEMKLPELEQRYTRAYYMPKEWIIDPAVIRRFDDIVLQEIVAVQFETQAKLAAVEAEGLKAMSAAIRKNMQR